MASDTYTFGGKVTVVLPAKDMWEKQTKGIFSKAEPVWFTDRSRKENGSDAEVYGAAPRIDSCFARRFYSTVL